jgi:YfdX protein
MCRQTLRSSWRLILIAVAAVVILGGPAWGQPAQSAAHEAKGGPVVRTFGAEGGYRTEVTSETRGTLSEEDRRQVATLTAQVFQHIDEARQALDADDIKLARREVDKGRQAMKAIRAIQPRTTVRTRTKAPDGGVVYEDEREVQEDQVPLFEGMLHAQTLAPIVEAKRDAAEVNAAEVKGVRLVESQSIRTEAVADLGLVEGQLQRAAKALEDNKADAASQALAVAQVRGVNFRYSKEDTPLAEARDAIWLARRSLEENNAEQARFNLNMARQRLRVYREIAPKERQADVDHMLKEADQLDGQLHRESAQNPASSAERTRQGNAVTRWWEQINGWFKKHF